MTRYMSTVEVLKDRNKKFSSSGKGESLGILPKLRTVVITCGDARVDPAYTIGLGLGDSVVIRNNGGRVNRNVIEELATISFMVSVMDGENPGPFEVVIIQHTQCGAERFSDQEFQKLLKLKTGVDVSSVAITNHNESIEEDINKLVAANELKGHISVSGFVYDVESCELTEIFPPTLLSEMRS